MKPTSAVRPALALLLLAITTPLAAQRPVRTRANLPQLERAEPLNGTLTVVAIDLLRGVVTAADHVSGYRARIEVSDRRLLRGVRVGQQVTTNRANASVLLANRQMLGRLTALASGGPENAGAPSPPQDVVARCQEESRKQSGAAVVCVPHGTLVSTGSSPGPEDDTYSWTCKCN